MVAKGSLRSRCLVVGPYNLRRRCAPGPTAAAKAGGEGRVKHRAPTSKSAEKKRPPLLYSTRQSKGSPFPRYPIPVGKPTTLSYQQIKEQTMVIVERHARFALQYYISNNSNQENADLEFVRILDFLPIPFYGFVYNLKFEAMPKGLDHDCSRVFFAQVHVGENHAEAPHVSRCSLYDADIPDVVDVHGDCRICFPRDPHQDQEKGVTAIFNRVPRKWRSSDPGKGVIDLTRKEKSELIRYHSIPLGKEALEHYKTKSANNEDAALEFLEVVKCILSQGILYINFKAFAKNSTDPSPKLFVAVVHMKSELYEAAVNAHVALCYPFNPNEPDVAYISSDLGICPVCLSDEFRSLCRPRRMTRVLDYLVPISLQPQTEPSL